MGIISLVWGVLAIIGMLLALPPCLGWLNWFNIPFAIVGLIVSGISISSEEPIRSQAMAGLTMCLIAIVIGGIRLVIGFGIV